LLENFNLLDIRLPVVLAPQWGKTLSGMVQEHIKSMALGDLRARWWDWERARGLDWSRNLVRQEGKDWDGLGSRGIGSGEVNKVQGKIEEISTSWFGLNPNSGQASSCGGQKGVTEGRRWASKENKNKLCSSESTLRLSL
jgi:hypothetical protein